MEGSQGRNKNINNLFRFGGQLYTRPGALETVAQHAVDAMRSRGFDVGSRSQLVGGNGWQMYTPMESRTFPLDRRTQNKTATDLATTTRSHREAESKRKVLARDGRWRG